MYAYVCVCVCVFYKGIRKKNRGIILEQVKYSVLS